MSTEIDFDQKTNIPLRNSRLITAAPRRRNAANFAKPAERETAN